MFMPQQKNNENVSELLVIQELENNGGQRIWGAGESWMGEQCGVSWYK